MDKVVVFINEIKHMLKEALFYLHLDKDTGQYYENYLDFAVWICLHFQELILIERIVLDRPPMEEPDEHDIADNEWHQGITKDKEVANILNQLDELHDIQYEIADDMMPGSKFAKRFRKGLDVFLVETLQQYQAYLKGFYFHSANKTKEALKWYTESLKIAQPNSINFMRLQALENIEMIIRNNRKIEKKSRHVPTLRSRCDRKMLKPPALWKTRNMVYKHLSHHYIMQKSVIFIVDTFFTSQNYTDLANKFVLNEFMKLDKEDYFGYISLEENSELQEMILEKKYKN